MSTLETLGVGEVSGRSTVKDPLVLTRLWTKRVNRFSCVGDGADGKYDQSLVTLVSVDIPPSNGLRTTSGGLDGVPVVLTNF